MNRSHNNAQSLQCIEEAGKIDDAAETELKSALDEFVQAFSA